MSALRTFEEVVSSSVFYLISVDPSWTHYHPTELPKPIRDWLNEHLPGVQIERIAGFEFEHGCHHTDNASGWFCNAGELPHPLFWIGLTAEQASLFSAEWSRPERQPSAGQENFYFAQADISHMVASHRLLAS